MKIQYKALFTFLFLSLFSPGLFAQSDNIKIQEELQSAQETLILSQQIILDPALFRGGGILLLQDNSAVNADSVEAMLITLGLSYTRSTSAAFIAAPAASWLNYDAVIWVGTTSTGAELDSATAYLDAGGRLIVAENDAAWFFGGGPCGTCILSSLFTTYFQALFVSDEGSDGLITGTDIMTGLALDISGDPFPDDVSLTGATGIFLAPGDTTWAATRSSGSTDAGLIYRTGLLLWDPQWGGQDTATSIFGRIIDYVAFGVVPVELTSFSASVVDNDVTLNWTTATEINNSGFNIERKAVNSSWETIAFVAGFGTTTETKSYSFVDSKLNAGSYTYRLKQMDFNGAYEYSYEVYVDVTGPVEFALEQNFPNPFNPNTTINYSVAKDGFVNVAVFNLLGEKVAVLVNTIQQAGRYDVTFDASQIPSGIYFYSIEAGDFKAVRKMTLLK